MSIKPCVAIVQARMGSTRLPDKVLIDIEGKSMLERVAGRTSRAASLHKVLVATSLDVRDDAIQALCMQKGIEVFRGDENDVLDRYYRAAKSAGAGTVVRITADCPLMDPEVIDLVVTTFLKSKADYASNVADRSFPRGLDVEVMTAAALARAWSEAKRPHQRVHVTPYIYENPNSFSLLTIQAEKDYSEYRWTVDTPEDLELVRAIYRRMKPRDYFSWKEVLALFEADPALFETNRNVRQKKLEEC